MTGGGTERPGRRATRPLDLGEILARSVLRESDYWHLDGARATGKLWAYGRAYVAAEGPEAYGRQAIEALARSYHLAEPYLHVGQFLELMRQQGVPLAAAEAWARGARVTEDGVYLAWETPR